MELTKARDEFVQGGVSLRELSRRYPVSYATLQRTALREDWKGSREQWLRENQNNGGLQQRIDTVADVLLAQIETAASQLTLTPTVTRTKEKLDFGERTTEQRLYENGLKVDVKELKELTAALKNLRELRIPKSPLDIREQEAKVRNLERQSLEPGSTAITVTLDGDIGEYAV